MNESSYPFALSRQELRYEFVSVSAEKEVKKVVILSPVDENKIYNLALFDLLDNDELGSPSKKDADDLAKINTTVSCILNDFLEKNPGCSVVRLHNEPPRQLVRDEIVQKELDEMNELLRKTDLSNLFNRHSNK